MNQMCFNAPCDILPADHDHEEDQAAAECNLWNRPVRQEGLLRSTGMSTLHYTTPGVFERSQHVNLLVCNVALCSGAVCTIFQGLCKHPVCIRIQAASAANIQSDQLLIRVKEGCCQCICAAERTLCRSCVMPIAEGCPVGTSLLGLPICSEHTQVNTAILVVVAVDGHHRL